MRWVLYVDLPTGQVSFHAPERGAGPNYPGKWNGVRGVSGERIVCWCQSLIPDWRYDKPIMDNAALRAKRQERRRRNKCLIVGDTYPLREQLKSLGGQWDPDRKGWWVPGVR